MTLSVRAMAEALGVGKSQVQRCAAAGMPMTDPAAARAWREAHQDVSRTAAGRIDRPAAKPAPAPAPAAPPTTVLPPAPPPADDTPEPDDTDQYRQARAERERIRRDRELLELEQLRGRLIDLEDAKRLAFTAFRGLRDAILQVPSRVMHPLAVETDALAIEALLERELEAVLERWDARRLTSDADDDDDETG